MTARFEVVPTSRALADAERARILADPGFGKYFTDHMASAVWTPAEGWHDLQIRALEPFSLHPATAVLHYGQEAFEGLKAYRHADGSIWLFRPTANAARFARSARRLALPEVDEPTFLAAVTELVRADHAWVPQFGGEHSLYLRPFMFASEAFLGVRPAAHVTFGVIASPAGPYFPSGISGVTLWVTTTYTRAAPGGTGAAKCGGNYASGLAAQLEALEQGCDQVLFTDGAEHVWLEEAGTMNLCLVTGDHELLTPGLGTILEGVTRDSVLSLAAEHGFTPVERRISIDELRERCSDGSVTEVFAAGTAAVITPVVALRGEGWQVRVADGRPGKRTLALREHILGIQRGHVPDARGWLHRVR